MEFRVLGPLEALDGGQSVDLPRRKHRALLAALLLHAPEPVSPDRLIEELWGESPPRTARDALQNYVSLLRKALGADVLVTRDAGYVLDVAPDQIDLGRFERLCAEARAAADVAERAGSLREALGLWRGPPLADIAYEPFAALEIARLEELRLAAREELIDAELELGRHADLVPELELLVQEHPFDERLRGQLMLALYRAGRQAEALEAYQEARRELDEELGLEPGTLLRQLEQAILRHDPALGMPAAVPATAISRRTVTVLFADLVDSSGLVERLDPEAAHALLGRYFAAARAAIEAHGGTVEKFIGDAVMAVFGVPQAHEDDALRAVRAALDLHASAPEADERLSIRIGISTGEVFAAGGGEALVTGAAVTLAKRLEQAARGGEVLVSAATQRLVRDAVRSRRAKRRDLTAFRIEGLIEGAPGLARRFDTPLVGRDDELAALRAAFEAAHEESRCVLFTVAGEAGIGKTRLARELLRELRGEATVLVGRCVSYGEGATFLPLTEMIGRDVLEAGSTLEIFLAARRRFEELAAEEPLLLVFEDVHWAEPTLLDFVDYLAAQATGAPILALCLARPDLIAERAGWEASLTLEPLTDDEVRELAGDEPHADRIAEIAEGNPLYVQQLAAYVGEEGEAALDSVPGSIEALLASRLDRLGAEERAVAQRAAVVGRRFSSAALAALGPVDALPALERAGFVRRVREVYRFHHVLVRDVVYAGTPKAERAELHREHADWLAAQPDGADELIGYHLEQAAGYLDELGAPGQQVTRIATNAGRRLGAAGIAAWKRGDARATANLLGRATALLPEQDEERLRLMCELGEAMHTAGDLTTADGTLSEAAEGAEAAGLRALQLRAQLALLNLQAFGTGTASADDLLNAALTAIPTLTSHEDDRALGRAWYYASSVHGAYHCRYADAGRAARQALFHYQRAGWPTAVCLLVLAASIYNGPTPVPEAVADCIALLTDADVNTRANVLAHLAGLRAMQGDFDRARQELLEARSLFTEIGQGARADILCGQIEADIELLAGDETRAQELLEANRSALERSGSRAFLATAKAALGDVLYRRGRVPEADQLAQDAQAHSPADDVPTQSVARTVQAKVLARSGQFAEAEQLAEQAVALLDPTDILNRKAACLLDFAEVLAMADRPAEGIALIERAVDLYRLKENDVGAARAQALLAAAI